MSYAQGSTIAASDYNGFTGGQDLTVAFASAAAATQKASALLGVGYGDRGYGQTTPSLPAKVSGNSIAAIDWSNLRTALSNLNSHQGSGVTLPAAAVAGSSVAYDANYAAALATLDSNRFNTNSGASMTLTSNALTITRAGTWGGGAAGITAVETVTFASEDAARYFFNTGGELRFALSHPAGSTQDNNWNAALAAVGTIAFKANTTTRSGTSGTPAAVGYYQLTTTNQSIVSGVIGTGSYTANSITVSARAAAITGLNGAKGFQIIFTFYLYDGHANAFSDVCAAGTAVVASHLRSTAVFSIAAPTFAQTQAWA